ncbi:MAG: protease modulator HflC [Phycisphaerales bacterium]|nr:MAG: protease modulator HflC [Phycisphaerales bacterium]
MKHIAIPILIGLIFLIMCVYLVTFQVRETESAFITRFGMPVSEITEPGLYFKWPSPIERAHKFDSRMRVFEDDLGETTTKGAVPIIVKTYVVWRIAEPLKFLNAVGSVQKAETKLLSQLGDTRNIVIGQYTFGQFVNSDPNKIELERIQGDMLAQLKGPMSEQYGIEIKTLGIKQLKVNEDVSKDIFERMKAERTLRTAATIAEGAAQATSIKTDAKSKSNELLAAANARAEAIKGEGDAKAAEYYKMLEENQELAIFLRNLKALKKTLGEGTTVVLPADSDPFRYLKEIPSLEPKQ